ncbi:MAG: branched-chain amino acid ABC transporter permease [Candidatus Promineofilum sp.]|nr:branched-chain amino acid ABC transporter permease [Promineifilum sp.]MBP9656953.1 branched-chain amino acid ABC transporter permease [Promineifilum sp.]
MTSILKNNRSILIAVALTVLIFAGIVQSMEPRVWVSIMLSGATLASLYFLVASGLSLIFGLMDVLNFAHGVLFVLGAYVGLATFMNPRLLFNTLPIFFILIAAIMLSQHLARLFWPRIHGQRAIRLASIALMLLAAALLFFALRGFPIRALNAFNITAVGGAVLTADAQEPMAMMFRRLALLALAGIPLGILLSPKERQDEVPLRPFTQTLLIAGLAAVIGIVLLLVRDAGEQWLLGLSTDIRFILALIMGTIAGALGGVGIETALIRPFYGNPVTQLVLTLGLSIAGIDLIEAMFGEEANPPMPTPSMFGGNCRSDSLTAWLSEHCQSIDVLGRAFPTYRLFIIVVGVLVFIGVGLMLRRTRLGMIIRAGVQDSEMVQALGINVRRVFTLVFALGSALAAMGGVIAAPYLGVFPGMGAIYQLQAFIAVVIGGMGSFIGAAVGTIILGMARAFGDHFVAAGITLPFIDTVIKGSPAIARASTVLIMAIVLLVKPSGIFGKKE